ncbi:MAG: hypothetical protein AAB845_01100, partial [Patescibacteria group bacterium]
MQTLLGLFYSLIFLCYVFAAVFVLFHLLRYSLNKRNGLIGALIFATVSALLLFINAFLFFSLPFEELLITSNTFAL